MPDEDACLDILFALHYTGKACPVCKHPKYRRVKGRACYECGKCRRQVYPKTDTLMKDTKLPISKWIYAIYFIVTSKNSISSLELAIHLGVTNKVGWRMLNKIQSIMKEDTSKRFSGTIEIDSTLIGGKMKAPKGGKKVGFNGKANKTVVFAMRQLNPPLVRSFIIKEECIKEVIPLVEQHIEFGSRVYSDEAGAFKCLTDLGYKHSWVNHKRFEWKRGWVTTQRLEGYWSYIKRSILGTHIHISKKYTRNYLDEYEFRYNHCDDGTRKMFLILLDRLFVAAPGSCQKLFFPQRKP